MQGPLLDESASAVLAIFSNKLGKDGPDCKTCHQSQRGAPAWQKSFPKMHQ